MSENNERNVQAFFLDAGHILKNQTILINECWSFGIINYDEVSNFSDEIEIMEWWLIDDWMARKLRFYDEPVLENRLGIWWGRTCTGQAWALDGVINSIYEDAHK